MLLPVLVIGGTFVCLVGAIVLLAAELARTWKDPNNTEERAR